MVSPKWAACRSSVGPQVVRGYGGRKHLVERVTELVPGFDCLDRPSPCLMRKPFITMKVYVCRQNDIAHSTWPSRPYRRANRRNQDNVQNLESTASVVRHIIAQLVTPLLWLGRGHLTPLTRPCPVEPRTFPCRHRSRGATMNAITSDKSSCAGRSGSTISGGSLSLLNGSVSKQLRFQLKHLAAQVGDEGLNAAHDASTTGGKYLVLASLMRRPRPPLGRISLRWWSVAAVSLGDCRVEHVIDRSCQLHDAASRF